ncbi:hypothetical protein [Candidatus Enterococcus huntleyi]|uniref:hypothetical protein n=1 Tax=Candidatus Enterococcus huntleyi TaxID=1857217 RepID=UPI00137A2ECD|nr:hypothetical protein [Enterococcus sp. JM4C]
MFILKFLLIMVLIFTLYSFQRNFRELYAVLETKNRLLRVAQSAVGSVIGIIVDGI